MKQVRLSDVIELADSGTWGVEATPESGSPVLRSSNIQNFKLTLEGVAWRGIPAKDVDRKKLQDGDIIVTASSGSSELIGKCAIFYQPQDARTYFFSNFTYRLRSNHKILDPKFLFYWLISERARSYLKKLSDTTSGLRNLNKTLYLRQLIPLPPLSEQGRIVAILDKADALRETRRQTITTLERLMQSVFFDTFGQKAASTKDWKTITVGEAVDLINGRAFKPTEWSKKGQPIIRIQNLKNSNAPFNYFEGLCEDKYIVKAGDLLLSWAGQLVSFGVVTWSGATGWLNQHIFRVVPKLPFEIPYLEYALIQVVERAKSTFHGIEMKHITKTDLNKYELPYPSLEIQKRFAQQVLLIRVIKAHQQNSLAQLSNLFHSLQQRAFNGELPTNKTELTEVS
jgi:type I restriction enzyme, S subunit